MSTSSAWPPGGRIRVKVPVDFANEDTCARHQDRRRAERRPPRDRGAGRSRPGAGRLRDRPRRGRHRRQPALVGGEGHLRHQIRDRPRLRRGHRRPADGGRGSGGRPGRRGRRPPRARAARLPHRPPRPPPRRSRPGPTWRCCSGWDWAIPSPPRRGIATISASWRSTPSPAGTASRPGGNATRGWWRRACVGGTKVLALKPQTYMNGSGDRRQPAAAFHKIPPQDICAFHDELDLVPGKVRVKRGGGAAGP